MTIRRWRVLGWVLGLGYVAGWTATALVASWTPGDIEAHYWPAVREVLSGHPLRIYSPQGAYRGAGIDHGPVSLVPLSAAGYILRLFGRMEDPVARRAVAAGLYALLCLGMAREGVRAVERAREAAAGMPARIAMAAGFLALPALVEAGAAYGHIEVPISVWLCLLSLRCLDRGHDRRSAAFLGVALLTRDTSLLLAVPVGFMMLKQRGPRAASAFVAIAGTCVVAGIAPFYLADPSGLRYSLFGFRRDLVINYGGLLGLAKGTVFEGVATRWDAALIAAVLVIGSAWVVRRRPDILIGSTPFFVALMGISACFPLLAKATFAYYLVESGVFGFVAWFSEWGRERMWNVGLPVIMLLVVSLLEVFQAHGTSDPGTRLTVSLVCGGLLILAIRSSIIALQREPATG